MMDCLKYKTTITISCCIMFVYWMIVSLRPEFVELNVSDLSYQWMNFYQCSFVVGLYMAVLMLIAPKTFYTCLPKVVKYSVILGGIYETVLGYMQLMGIERPLHPLYSLTGSFYNPGPYSGFIAISVPLVVYEYYRNKKSKFIEIVFLVVLAMMLVAVCFAQSRAAIISAVAGSVIVCLSVTRSWLMFKCLSLKLKAFLILSLVILVLVMGVLVFYAKFDSAYGRLFIWKISCMAIAHSPLVGYGTGKFAQTYGSEQESYFATQSYTDKEVLVAGSPECAFNEFLQIAVEHGVIIMLFVLFAVGVLMYLSFYAKDYGVLGAMCSLFLFSCFSYPMDFPAFWVVALLCVLSILSANKVFMSRKWIFCIPTLCIIGTVSSFILCHKWMNRHELVRTWHTAQILYRSAYKESATTSYESLYEGMQWNPRFLFEYGHLMMILGEYQNSIEIMKKAESLSNDPMILNIIGKDYQYEGQYDLAESYFKRSRHRVPSRMYPDYLLIKMYSSLPNRHDDAILLAGDFIERTPKVLSPAIKEMKRDVEGIMANLKK